MQQIVLKYKRETVCKKIKSNSFCSFGGMLSCWLITETILAALNHRTVSVWFQNPPSEKTVMVLLKCTSVRCRFYLHPSSLKWLLMAFFIFVRSDNL